MYSSINPVQPIPLSINKPELRNTPKSYLAAGALVTQAIPAGDLLSLMELRSAEAAGQMKLRVGQLVRFSSLTQT